MTLYAIRQKSTGLYLPQKDPVTKRNQRVGFTHNEPSNGLPRLFEKESYVKKALNCWLKGSWSMKFHGEYGSGGLDIRDHPNRKSEDMEVVRMVLSRRTNHGREHQLETRRRPTCI